MVISTPIKKSYDVKQDEIIDQLIAIINTGRAILFTGAGFSFGAENILKKKPPMAKELARMIAQKGEFEEDDDLSYVSDYFLTYKDKQDLLHLLKENYTIVNCNEYLGKISSMSWKRIYTTNYDNSIEKSAEQNKKIIYSLTVDDNPKEFYKKKNCCVHINGSISSVSEDDLDSKFKLTRTSYITPDSFVNSPWYYYFKKDLEQSNAIVFIGYSLYDIDIEKVLFASQVLKKKTYFIVSETPSNRETFVLSKYGHVLPIGVDGFGSKLNLKPATVHKEAEFWLDSLEKYQLSDLQSDISDDQILSFILYGKLKDEHIDHAISAYQKKPYMIIRESIEEVMRLLNTNKYLCITSDFGNGKSILLKQLMSNFGMLGHQVFFLQNPDGDYAKDIEKINNLNEGSIVIIDDYSLNIEVLFYLIKYNSNKIKVIFADRTNNHDRMRKNIVDEGVTFSEIAIDVMHKNEIEHLVSIIDNLGFWGEKAALSQKRKVDLIQNDDRGQISHTLLGLFNSPQIKNRIESLLSPLVNNNAYKDTIFAICLLEVVNLPRSSSLISELAGNDHIYKSDLRNNVEFQQLFELKDDKVISKSSVFSTTLLKNFFSSSYLTNKLLELAEKYNLLRNNGVTEMELFKSLLRFSFAERLLPEKGKLNSLVKYYEELKVRVAWLKYDPHFWLQYGMARMNFGQLTKAQSNLDEAYVLAGSKEGYDTSYLDTQQARLYILKAMDVNDGNIIWEFFQKAQNLLNHLEDDIYTFRQVISYKRFFDKKYHSLSKSNKKNFEANVRKMKDRLEKSTIYHPDDFFRDYSLDICHRALTEILEKI